MCLRQKALQVLSAKARFVKLVIEGRIVIRKRSMPELQSRLGFGAVGRSACQEDR